MQRGSKSDVRSLSMRACAFALAVFATGAVAQSYPNRPIRLIVGFPPGGATDVAARAIGLKVGESIGQPVIVDNRPGAAGNIGAEAVSKAAPDGYTLLMGSIALAINPSLYARLNYDALRDLAAVSQVTSAPFILVTHPSVPATSVKQLIALAKAQPGQLNFSSAGSGSGSHLFGELFREMAGVDIVHIPYKGAIAMSIVSGQVPMGFDNMMTSLPLSKSGKLRVLAVTTITRSPIVPDLPTVAEAGVPGYDANSWFGVFAPAATPKELIMKLHTEIANALHAHDLRGRLLALGAEPVGSTPDQYSQFFRVEVAKWAKVVKNARLKVD